MSVATAMAVDVALEDPRSWSYPFGPPRWTCWRCNRPDCAAPVSLAAWEELRRDPANLRPSARRCP